MAVSSRLPLYLFQVLEEEYAALHGNRPLDSRGWNFTAAHIKDPEELLKALGLSGDKETKQTNSQNYIVVDPDQSAKKALKDYLRSELEKRNFSSKAIGAELVAEALNTFIDPPDPGLFAEERFSIYWLNDVTRDVRNVHLSKPLEANDLAHFNRLLLEDAFPDALDKIHRIRLNEVYSCIHEKKQIGLCLSGGGIRSGTFALGLLQGLARHDLLRKFHYLSTVSGGGYIGSWLAAWIHRHPGGLTGVTTDLANTTPYAKVDPDPPPIGYLRRYSSFITPKVGLLSADTWTFISIYFRNLFLNWLVFIPLMLWALTIPRLVVSLTITWSQNSLWSSDNFKIYGRHIFLLAGFIFTTWALAYIMFNRPSVREELRQASETWRRRSTQRWFLLCCLLPLTLAAFSLTTYWAWSSQNDALPKTWWRFLLFGVLVVVFAWIESSYILGRLRVSRLFRNLKNIFTTELLYLGLAGGVGGVVLWWLTRQFDPFQEKRPWDCLALGSWLTLKVELYACLATPAFLLVVLLGITLYIGLTSKISTKLTSVEDEDREWWARLSAWVLIVILGWIAFTAIVIFGPLALLKVPQVIAPLGGISGLLAALAGRSAKTPGSAKAQGGPEKPSLLSVFMGKVVTLLALVFIAFLLSVLSLATTSLTQVLTVKLPGLMEHLVTWPSGFNVYTSCIIWNVPGTDFFARARAAHINVLHLTSFRFVLILGILLFVVGYGLSRLMNLNIFSLHGGYRNRLIRAFLGASRPDHQRKPNPFTGFDPADNFNMHELRPGLFDEDDFPQPVKLANVLLNRTDTATLPDPARAAAVVEYLSKNNLLRNLQVVPDTSFYSVRLVAALRKDLNSALQDPGAHEKLAATKDGSAKSPSHITSNRTLLQQVFGEELIKAPSSSDKYRLLPVINTTLNLVGGDNLAWQQRKAEPFCVTPLYSGCFRLGYRDSRFYGGGDRGGISIGTAAAISGAAASSNMGYYTTSPVLSLVLTFFNVRLGWWLGNPGTAGNKTFYERAPKSSVTPIISEAFGLTDDQNKYVYLTDGGHFENLGIYEMVLRRCRVIIVSDAAADPEYHFADLGNAIRKVRIDLGVPIEFTAMPIFKCEPGEKTERKGMYWAIGKIRYSCIDGNVEDGVLLYIKPVVYGHEPGDVLEYKKSHPTFPHQSTADQFFDEPQFESYRALGSYVIDQICGEAPGPLKLYELLTQAGTKLLDEPADPGLKDWWEKWRTKFLARDEE